MTILQTSRHQGQSKLTAPLLVQSSKTLGWQDIEAQTYLEPEHLESWIDPVTPDITLMLLTRGSMRLVEQDCDSCKGFHIRQGDLLLKPAATVAPPLRWQSQSSEPLQTLRLRLSYALFCRTIEELADRDPARVTLVECAGFQDQLLLQVGLALGKELESPSISGSVYAQTAAHMLAVHLVRYYTVEPITIQKRWQGLTTQQIQRVTDYIQAHLIQALTLEELAQQIGFSPYHFARLFRQATGESPHQFIVRLRVEQAQRLLKNTDLPITQVATDCGFAHQSHLTQAFKRYVTMTPKAFRQRE